MFLKFSSRHHYWSGVLFSSPTLFKPHTENPGRVGKEEFDQISLQLDIVLHWAFHYELRAVTLWSDHHRVLIPALPFTSYLLESE